MKTGLLIKQLRDEYKVTLQKLEELTWINYTQIIRYEKWRSKPKYETLFKIIKNWFKISEIQTNDLINEYKIFEIKKLLSEDKKIEIFWNNIKN